MTAKIENMSMENRVRPCTSACTIVGSVRSLPSDGDIGVAPFAVVEITHSVKVGVYRDVTLDLPGRTWIADVWVRSDLSADHSEATLSVQVETRGAGTSLDWCLADPAGTDIARGKAPVAGGEAAFRVKVPEPKLWWPRTHGKANLYRLDITLADGIDRHSVNVGIRRITAVLKDPDTGEKRFRFDVNGRPIFLRGADLAPIEGMTHCWNEEKAGRLLDLMEHGRRHGLRRVILASSGGTVSRVAPLMTFWASVARLRAPLFFSSDRI